MSHTAPSCPFLALQALRVLRDAPESPKGAQRAYERPRNALALEFVGLVKSRAKRWVCAGVDVCDLEQEGMIGLLEALDRFDLTANPTRTDTRKHFVTYAVHFIDGAIGAARPKATLGRLSIGEHAVRYAERIAKQDAESWRLTGELDDAAAAEATPGRKHAAETVQAMRAYRKTCVSLDSRIPLLTVEDGMKDFHDVTADTQAVDSFEALAEKEQRGLVESALKTLDPAAARVLRWRYGLVEVVESAEKESA